MSCILLTKRDTLSRQLNTQVEYIQAVSPSCSLDNDVTCLCILRVRSNSHGSWDMYTINVFFFLCGCSRQVLGASSLSKSMGMWWLHGQSHSSLFDRCAGEWLQMHIVCIWGPLTHNPQEERLCPCSCCDLIDLRRLPAHRTWRLQLHKQKPIHGDGPQLPSKWGLKWEV